MAQLPQTVLECHAVIAQLLERVKLLEERANLDANNSSTPPSSNGPGSMNRALRAQVSEYRLYSGRCTAAVTTDCYAGYAFIDVQRRQACWARLLRDFYGIGRRQGLAGQIGRRLLATVQRWI
jgi:hypothetical protein